MAERTMSEDAILEKLRAIPLFEAFREDPHYLGHLLEVSRVRQFKKGEEIISEGDLGAAMYILSSGEVQIRKRTRAGDTYTVVNLRSDQNVFFGELALIDDDRRSATVVAQSDAECLEITKEKFIDLGNEHPAIGLPVTREIAKILAARLRKTNEDMMTIFDALVNELRG